MDPKSIKKYKSVLPSEAIITKNYREFCRIIKDHFIDIKHKIRYLCEKVDFERNILRTKSAELTERDKKNIFNYIKRLEFDIAKWIKIRNRLYKLANSEKRLLKVFNNLP